MKFSLLQPKNFGTLKLALRKAICRVVILFIITLVSQHLVAQTLPGDSVIVLRNWQILGESSQHMDVSSRLVRCDSVNQLQLKVFNESNADQSITFQVTVTNSLTNENIIRNITVFVLKLQELAPACTGNNQLPELKIELPGSFNPLAISAIIIF